MFKPVTAFFAACIAGFALVGSAEEASAGYRRCSSCGPLPPSYVYRTVNRVTHRTRYRDVTRTRYVPRVHRIVHVTRVQPVVRIHQVTRVHHRTVGVVKPVHVSRYEYLPARTYVTNSVRHSYECGCR